MPILWREQMSVGNMLIDDDHKYLICLINTAELALKTPENIDTLSVIIQQLVRYTEEHFAREEKIQLKARFPHYADHKMEHQSLVQQLNDIKENVRAADPESNEQISAQAAAELVNLLRVWLLEHILKLDKRMEPYLRKLPATFM